MTSPIVLAVGNAKNKAERTEVAALAAQVAGFDTSKADQSALDALTTTVAGKASQGALDTLTGTVAGKASQGALDTLTTTVAGKASAASVTAVADDLDALSADVAAIDIQRGVEPYQAGRVVLRDEDGLVVATARTDGSMAFGPQTTADWLVETRGAFGGRQVWAWAAGVGEFEVSNGLDGDDASMPKLENLRLTWRDEVGGLSYRRTARMAAGMAGLASSTVYAMFVLGQSTSNGNATAEVLTEDPPAPTRVYMPEGSLRPLANAQLESSRFLAMRDARMVDFVPAYERLHGGSGETGWALAGWRATQTGLLGASEGVVAATLGIGSIPYDADGGCNKGTPPYANLMRLIKRTRIACGLNGKTFRMPWMFHPWHEASVAQGLTQAQILAQLLQAQSDYSADIGAIMRSDDEVLLVTDALASFSHYAQTPALAYAVLQAATENPTKIVYACPRYFLDHTVDNVHLTAASCALRGEYFARAAVRAWLAEEAQLIYMTSAVRTAAHVVVTFHHAADSGPLRFNTDTVSDPGRMGFTWRQTGGTAANIDAATYEWTDTNVLEFDLTANPGSPSSTKLGYADQSTLGDNTGPLEGPRGCVSDSSLDESFYGLPMVNYAAPQEITVT